MTAVEEIKAWVMEQLRLRLPPGLPERVQQMAQAQADFDNRLSELEQALTNLARDLGRPALDFPHDVRARMAAQRAVSAELGQALTNLARDLGGPANDASSESLR